MGGLSANEELQSLWGRLGQTDGKELTHLADAGRVGRMSQELLLFLPTALIAACG